MKGMGYTFPKTRKYGRCWVRWMKRVYWIEHSVHGEHLYDKQQCDEVLNRIHEEIRLGTFDPATWGKDKTLRFPNAWRLYQEQSPCGPARLADRDRICNQFFGYFEGMHLKELEEHHVRDWFSKLPETMAPTYRRMILATLKGFLNFHRVTHLKRFRYPVVSVPRKVVSWLTVDEQDRVFEFIPVQHRPILTVIRTYGCRVSEACNLKKADIDWEKGLICFRDRKNYEDNVLPIVPTVEEALKTPKKINHWELAFCTERGRRYTRQALYATWIKANREAHEKYGIRVMALKNATRHSLASRLVEQGESIPTVARILGNRPSVVEKNYARQRASSIKELLANVDRK